MRPGASGRFLHHLLAQEIAPGDGSHEYLIADGMSDDGTRETILEVAGDDPRVILIDNPDRIVSSGLNAAIRVARGGIIVRMDVHTEYASDYIKACVDLLKRPARTTSAALGWRVGTGTSRGDRGRLQSPSRQEARPAMIPSMKGPWIRFTSVAGARTSLPGSDSSTRSSFATRTMSSTSAWSGRADGFGNHLGFGVGIAHARRFPHSSGNTVSMATGRSV